MPQTIDELPAGQELDVAVAQALLKALPFPMLVIADGRAQMNLPTKPPISFTWSPSINSDHAVGAARMMQARGYWMELHSPFTAERSDWWAGFTPLGTSGWNGQPDYTARGETPALAICRAILKTLESDEPPLSEQWDGTTQEIILGPKTTGGTAHD